MQNVIIKGKDNPVIMNFNFTGDFLDDQLDVFTDIRLTIGGETYSTLTNPTLLFKTTNKQIRLKIGDTTALDVGIYTAEVVGFSADYDDGYLLSGRKKPLLQNIRVV